MYLDSRADGPQREAMQKIFGGQVGGWPAQFAQTIGELRGIEFAPIEFEVAGDLAYWRARFRTRSKREERCWWGRRRSGATCADPQSAGLRDGSERSRHVGEGDHRQGGRVRLPVEPDGPIEQAHPVRLDRPRRVTPERERSAFAALSWRIHLAVVGVLLALSAIAWVRTVNDARSMSGMVMGLGQVGSLAGGSMSAGIFLAMWADHDGGHDASHRRPDSAGAPRHPRRRGGGFFPTIVFIIGYLAVWFASGVPALFRLLWLSRLAAEAAQSQWLSLLAGSIFMFAGTYQFTGWKQVCLDKCQSPFAFIVTHDFDGGVRSALRAGLWHGVFCLGCCWALMIVLLVVGVMNLAWMVGFFLVFLVEKSWKHGLLVARVAGAALVVLGVMVIVEPTLLPRIS